MLHLGACYYPEHWPRERWPEDARLMREAGLDTVRVGEFAWALMEPEPGRYDFSWLNEAVDILAAEGLQVVLGTPTAAPPAWLVKASPDVLPVDAEGRVRRPGSRRHYCLNSPRYNELADAITDAMASALGRHPAVVGWQLDNELGCHDTARCYCPRCAAHFRHWLKQRYQTIEAVNEAWGTVFWSQRYGDWDQIEPPARLVYTANPGHWLDWCRAASEANRVFLDRQAARVRAHSPGRWVTHNLMGGFDELDHARLVAGLDLVGWDNYAPPGWTPVQQAMAHDRMRGLLRRPFWVLEQQCGPINWGAFNPAPAPGQVRLWTYQAIAHGADGVLYFRWRAGLVGAEQLHSGILPHDAVPGRTFAEVRELTGELARLPPLAMPAARVALVSGEESRWALRHQPHHEALAEQGPDAYELPFYEEVRSLGLDMDVLPPDASLDGYAVVVAATAYVADDALVARLGAFAEGGGHVLFGPRAGFKDGHNRVRPGGLAPLTGVRVAELHAPGPDEVTALAMDGSRAPISVALLLERLVPVADGVETVATYAEGLFAGEAAVVMRRLGRGWVWYAGAMGSDHSLGRALVERIVAAAGLATWRLPDGVEVARRGDLTFVLNHLNRAVAVALPAPAWNILEGQNVTGELRLPPLGLAVLGAVAV